MKRVLVLGATGGTGSAIVQELLSKHLQVVVFGRSLEKLKQRWPSATDWRVGDVFDYQSIVAAGKDCETIFQCAAIPYHLTTSQQLPLGKSVMHAAQILKSRVVFIDGIYAYEATLGRLVRETDPLKPVSKKGATKRDLAELLFSRQYQDVAVALMRLPDYYGPTARKSSYLGMTLIGIAKRQPTIFIGRQSVAREFVYLPDAAKMIVQLADKTSAYQQAWNIPGQKITGRELVRLAKHDAGSWAPVMSLTKSLLRICGWFDADIREIVEMTYLTEKPVFLDGQKFRETIGPIAATSFSVGIAQTIESLRNSRQ